MTGFVEKLFFTVSIVFFAFGLFLLWERNNPKRLSFYFAGTLAKQAVDPHGQQPQSITIPKAHIALPIYPARIIGQTWEDTKQGVSFLSSSPVPGEQGNSILYGHNWPNLLGPLKKVKPGDKIFVTFPESIRVFTVEYVTVVMPDETYILQPTTDNRITLYTCTGFLDSKRLVITATLDTKDISLRVPTTE